MAVVEKLGLDTPSTRTLKDKLTERGWTNALFVTGNSTDQDSERARWAFELSSGNLPEVAVVTDVSDITVWDIVKRRNVVIDLEAVDNVINRIDPNGPWLEQEWEDLDEGEYDFEEEVGDLAERQALEEVASGEVRV